MRAFHFTEVVNHKINHGNCCAICPSFPYLQPNIASMKQLLVVLFIAFVSTSLNAQSSGDEKAVTAAVENLRKAMVDPTKAALEKLTSHDLSYGHSNGNLQDQS